MKYAALLVAILGLIAAGCSSNDSGSAGATGTTGSTAAGGTAQNTPASTGSYAAVQTVFNDNCISCHGADHPKAQLNLTTFDGVMKGNDEGPVVKAGDPDNSLLVQVLDAGHKPHMPPKKQLDDAKAQVIKDWIKAGAKNG